MVVSDSHVKRDQARKRKFPAWLYLAAIATGALTFGGSQLKQSNEGLGSLLQILSLPLAIVTLWGVVRYFHVLFNSIEGGDDTKDRGER